MRPLSLIAAVAMLLLSSPIAHARPPHRSRSTTKTHRAPGPESLPPLPPGAPLPPGVDAQTMVTKGRMLPFYDPANLAKTPVLSAPSAILVDADTGQVLWEKDADAPHFPASTTKIMTALLFIEHCRPDEVITCLDPSLPRIEESSLHIKPWEKFSAQDLLYGFLLRSANDGAVLIAEHVAGSVPKFADMMNERARQIGATNTHFVTPNGLHDPAHYTTARDMALIAREAMRNPRFVDAVAIPERFITRTILKKDSHIVAKAKRQFYDKFEGADGVKTGYTHQAGHCFVGSATREGRRLLSVVLDSRRSAITDTLPLLSWGFDRFAAVPLARKDAPVDAVTIRGGMTATVPTIAAGDLHVSSDRLAAPEQVRAEVRTDEATAPIRRGEVVGHLIARVNDKVVGGEVPLLAAEDVAASPLKAVAASGGLPLVGLFGAGGLAVLLIGFRYGTAASAKSSRRRRDRVAAARRGADRLGQSAD